GCKKSRRSMACKTEGPRTADPWASGMLQQDKSRNAAVPASTVGRVGRPQLGLRLLLRHGIVIFLDNLLGFQRRGADDRIPAVRQRAQLGGIQLRGFVDVHQAEGAGKGADRKSTRLNSSHGSIS